MKKRILDMCCGSRMFYFDKHDPNVLFTDIREFHDTLCDGRKLDVQPDMIADCTALPFEDETFNMVVFDPPHLLKVGQKSLNDEYAKKEAALISEYKEKEEALEAAYLDKGKAYKRQLEADYKSYKNQAGRLPLINKNAKEALSLLNANRFFKPKGVESILAQIIQKCEQ